MAKQKFYVVWVGRNPGIYSSWPACQEQTSGFDQAKFKSYLNRTEAEKAFKDGWEQHWGKGGKKTKQTKGNNFKRRNTTQAPTSAQIDYDSISVDVGTHGNPGPVEYQGVDTRTGEVIFSVGPIKKGTNNLGEFLAIVHALAYLHNLGSKKTIYTDSVNALKWINNKKVSTTLKRDVTTTDIWKLVDRAIHWLDTHTYENKILKWQTKKWGQIKADYGRK